jgi:sugar diacid utilization regulator
MASYPLIGELVELFPDRITVMAGTQMDRPVSAVRLICAPELPEAAPEVLWVLPAVEAASPRLDSVLLTLYRHHATGVAFPWSRVPEATKMLATRLNLVLLGVKPEDLDTVVQGWWRFVAMRQLTEQQTLEQMRADVLRLWEQAELAEAFLDGLKTAIGATGFVLSPGRTADASAPDGYSRIMKVVRYGRGSGTHIVLDMPRSWSAETVAGLADFITLFVGISMDREAAVIESNLRWRGEMLLEILMDQSAPSGSLIRAAKRYGLDISGENIVILWDLEEFTDYVGERRHTEATVLRLKRDVIDQLESGATAEFGRQALVLPHSDAFVLIVNGSSRLFKPDRVLAGVERIQARVQQILKRYEVRGIAAGVGFPYPGPQGLRRSFEEAQEALLVGRAQSGPGSVTHFKDLGVGRFLYGWVDSPRSHKLAEDLLKPLLEDDREHGGELLRTLRAYLDAQGRASVAAKALAIHRNSLRYRLDRIERLLKVDLNNPDVHLALQLAMRALPLDKVHAGSR